MLGAVAWGAMSERPAADGSVVLVTEDLLCPHCGYNLRGLTAPRCPECGLRFTAAALQSGRLRDAVAAKSDLADPWQPHQVALASLWDLLAASWHPGWRMRRLDVQWQPVETRWRGVMIMLLGSYVWLYVLATLLITAAIVEHTAVSPVLAWREAALRRAPAAVLFGGAGGLAAYLTVVSSAGFRLTRPRLGTWLRLGAHAVPALTLHGLVAYGLLLLGFGDQGLILRQGGLLPLFPLLVGVPRVLLELHARPGRVNWLEGWRQLAWRLLPAAVAVWWLAPLADRVLSTDLVPVWLPGVSGP